MGIMYRMGGVVHNVKKIERSANHSQIRIMEKFKITKKAKIAMAAACAVIAAFGGISFAQRTTLADYKNITLKKEKTTAKKSEIDSYIQQTQQQYQKEVKRAAKKGDVVIFQVVHCVCYGCDLFKIWNL